jgi:hypothetical protein
MIDVVVHPIRTGEGVAAPYIGVHILGEIRPAGGFVTLAESRWEDQIGPYGPKTQPYHKATEIRGDIRRLGGVEGIGNW